MNKYLRVAFGAGLTALVLTPASATHSWGGYHWAGNGSDLALKVNTAITSQWEASVDQAIKDWHASNELTLTRQNVTVDRKRCSPISGQILVCNASYGRRGWLGIASIWLDSKNHIVQGTTKLNDSYHNYAPYNQPAWRALVACQEPGHNVGLDHQDETFDNTNLGSCQDYTNDPDGPPSNEHPNAHDYDMLTQIYNHNDGYTTATSSTRALLGSRAILTEGIGDSPAEWGRPLRRDRLGRPDMFVKDFGGGYRVVTHVTWAIGEGPRILGR